MEVPTAQKSDREVAYGGLFIFGKKRHSSFSQANAMIKRSDKFRCSTQRRCLRYRVFASFTPCLCGIFHLNYNVEYFI